MSTTTVKPQKPWVASPKDRVESVLVFIVAIAISGVTVAVTPMKGKLAYVALFFISYLIPSSILIDALSSINIILMTI